LGKSPLTEEETLDNMILFSEVISECIDLPPEQMRDYVLQHYVGVDEVTLYNRKNILVL
jgi:hypothetical protein